MRSIWAESLQQSLEHALEQLGAAISDCPAELWEAPMWHVANPGPGHPFLGPDWAPITDPGQLRILAERWASRRSTPWSVAWHALETFDYDLSGEFAPWAPPPPFTGHPHWRDLPSLEEPWSPAQLLDYAAYCRERAQETLGEITDELAARPLPSTHRYAGKPHASILTGILEHTAEHAAQMRQFVTSS